jgi:PAS domain S-box-containing protein
MTKPDFEQILQYSNHGVIATDKQGKIVFINKRAKEILQFGRKKIVGVNLSRLLPMTAELVADCLKSGSSQLGSQVLGERLSLIVNTNAIKDRQKVVGAVCNFLTMEEFEASARNLESFDFLDKQFKTVYESSSDGLMSHLQMVYGFATAGEKLSVLTVLQKNWGALKKKISLAKKFRILLKTGCTVIM